MLVLPADHLINDSHLFWEAVRRGWPAAQDDYLVTFGVRPTAPETGYGYIRQGPPLKHPAGAAGVFQVARFVEKPPRQTALKYLEDGGYYWNSGVFLWKAATFLQAVARWRPGLSAGLAEMRFDARGRPEREAYGRLEQISVDHGVMEQHDRCAVAPFPAEMSWSDLGSWEAVSEVAPQDQDGNYLEGEVLAQDCRDSFLMATHRLVAGLGLRDLMVVETADGVLVAHRQQAQKVKDLVEVLKERGSEAVWLPRTVNRPWGTFTVLEEGPGYKIKRLEVHPQGILSLQHHHHRSEHWVVISGQAKVTRGEESLPSTPTKAPLFPRERTTAWRTREPGPRSSSRSRPAVTWAKTTSCAWRTSTAAEAPGSGHGEGPGVTYPWPPPQPKHSGS